VAGLGGGAGWPGRVAGLGDRAGWPGRAAAGLVPTRTLISRERARNASNSGAAASKHARSPNEMTSMCGAAAGKHARSPNEMT